MSSKTKIYYVRYWTAGHKYHFFANKKDKKLFVAGNPELDVCEDAMFIFQNKTQLINILNSLIGE